MLRSHRRSPNLITRRRKRDAYEKFHRAPTHKHAHKRTQTHIDTHDGKSGER